MTVPKIGFVLILTLGHLMAKAQTPLSVPESGRTVLIDGKFDPREWQDARRIRLTDSLELYVQQDRENIYCCLRGLFRTAVLGGVNLYLTRGDRLLNLHASAKLGERYLRSGSYGDWEWWNNSGWTANAARLDRIEERKFLPDEAKEFQLRKHRFTDHFLKLMLSVEYPLQLLPAYPAGATPECTNGWLILRF